MRDSKVALGPTYIHDIDGLNKPSNVMNIGRGIRAFKRQYLSCHQQRIYSDHDPHHHKH